jgi:putative lipoic acid-binding regulatory protein
VSDQDAPTTLLAFPCEFPIKVLGRRQAGFAQAVVDVVKRHAPEFDAATLEMRASREAKYLSLTLTIHATSREQLDGLYRELCDHPMVTMVL